VTHSPPPLLGEIFLSPPRGAWASLLAPPAPSRGNLSLASPRSLGLFSRPPRPLRGSLGRCLPPDPRQKESAADDGKSASGRGSCSERHGAGERGRGRWRFDSQMWGLPEDEGAAPSPGPMTPAMCVWRGSGGRHLPRLPRRGRGGREKVPFDGGGGGIVVTGKIEGIDIQGG